MLPWINSLTLVYSLASHCATVNYENLIIGMISNLGQLKKLENVHGNVTLCCNPNLGFATQGRVYKNEGQEWAQESHFVLPRVQKSVREWTPTLLNELPLWELESQQTPESSESDYRGQNSLDWRVPYTNERILECTCLKWACMTHLGIENTNYGPKKGRESNGQFDSRPLKVKNRPNSLACKWCATYCWKALNEGYSFSSDLISIGSLHTKLWVSKVAEVPVLRILGLQLKSPKTKITFGCWSCDQAHSIL
jgi:hypothetical protein